MDGIGAWLLETTEFRQWHIASREDEANYATLFCDGNPGVGKTYIMYEIMYRCRKSKNGIADRLR